VVRHQPEAERMAKQPYRAAYKHASYRRNRAKRYRMARGMCESCGVELGPDWQCDHVVEARLFADPGEANAVENLRVLCRTCHAIKTRAQKRR
jgi:5-methylcytosine-specific restriction endonuclease McrA